METISTGSDNLIGREKRLGRGEYTKKPCRCVHVEALSSSSISSQSTARHLSLCRGFSICDEKELWEKSKVREEFDSTIPDSRSSTVTSTTPVIAPFTELRGARLEQEMSEVKKTDHSTDVLASIRSQVPMAVDNYLGIKLDDALLKVLERHTANIIEKYSVLPGLESVKNQESEKTLIADEDAMDKEVADKVKDHKRKHDSDDDEDDDDDKGPSAGSNQGLVNKRRRSDSAAFWFQLCGLKANLNTTSCGLWHSTYGGLDRKGISTSTKQCALLIVKQSDRRCEFSVSVPTHIQEKTQPSLPKTARYSSSLHTAVNMWIRNLVIRNRVGDLQLGIESYQTKINLERPNWDAADYYFKEDYTIVPKPRAVVYRDRNDQRKLMRLNELHKFSDGTLTRVMEKLDHMVKDFHLFEYNKGMETRKWSEDDKRRSKDFITAIEKRLQIRRIYRSLESFVGGRIRDIDYRLINRTTSKSENKGKVPTEMELVLELTQQGSSHEVSVSTEGVEELKGIVKIKGVKKEALHTLRQKPEHPSETNVFHNEDGNPTRANIKQALGSYERSHKGVKASANSDIVYFFTSAQDGDPLQDDVRLCLGDDLKKA
ncbi:hypothetical protein Tco_0389094 [Tanacetum coccineum]